MAEYLLAEDAWQGLNYQIGVERCITDRSNPLENMTPEEVKHNYRFLPETIIFILDGVKDSLVFPNERGDPFPPIISVLVTLEFLATGGFFHTIGLANEISKASAFRAVEKVCTLICGKKESVIRWPHGQSLLVSPVKVC